MVMIQIYLQCKEWDKALDEIELLLSQRIAYTPNNFILLDEVDPIRDNPRFKALMKEYAYPPGS